MADNLIPGSILAMSSSAADRLLRADNGDASLLYLHLLRSRPAADLHWTQARLQDAMVVLQKIGLAPESTPIPQPAPAPENSLPEYTQETINDALADPSSGFSALCDEMEQLLGKRLTNSDLKELYRLLDYFNLPAEVILLAANWCVEQVEREKGPASRPRMSYIRREASGWAAQGITSLDQAKDHIRRLEQMRSREIRILRLMDLAPRPLIPQEKQYIASWEQMGFGDDAIRLAYERTINQIHELKWSYMNGILRRWHQKNLHTAEAIQAGDVDPEFRRRAAAPSSPDAPPDASPASSSAAPTVSEEERAAIQRDMERARRMLERWQEKEKREKEDP